PPPPPPPPDCSAVSGGGGCLVCVRGIVADAACPTAMFSNKQLGPPGERRRHLCELTRRLSIC
ncbi:hypothetical protein, partial [Escherichia coli]|uniref:hypothetical protein n=1 Tax=Escherichia coli TaxID=562 RepID=UPI001BAEDA69